MVVSRLWSLDIGISVLYSVLLKLDTIPISLSLVGISQPLIQGRIVKDKNAPCEVWGYDLTILEYAQLIQERAAKGDFEKVSSLINEYYYKHGLLDDLCLSVGFKVEDVF